MKVIKLLLAAFLVTSCADHTVQQPRNIYCGVEDPATELEWLSKDLEPVGRSSVYMDAFLYTALYQGNRVFYISICCPACNVAPPEVKNCEGTVLGRLGDGIDEKELSGQQIIWRTVNGVCTRD